MSHWCKQYPATVHHFDMEWPEYSDHHTGVFWKIDRRRNCHHTFHTSDHQYRNDRWTGAHNRTHIAIGKLRWVQPGSQWNCDWIAVQYPDSPRL